MKGGATLRADGRFFRFVSAGIVVLSALGSYLAGLRGLGLATPDALIAYFILGGLTFLTSRLPDLRRRRQGLRLVAALPLALEPLQDAR